MGKRLRQWLWQKGCAITVAMVIAMTVVERRAVLPVSVPPIVLRVDPWLFPPRIQRRASLQGLFGTFWLN